MSDTPADRAVAVALHFEAKKTGFGQMQDGWSLTLRITNEDIERCSIVRDAPKGTRWQVAMVLLGDDEEPVSEAEYYGQD